MSEYDDKIKEAKAELDAAQRKYDRVKFLEAMGERSQAKPLKVTIHLDRVMLEIHGTVFTVHNDFNIIQRLLTEISQQVEGGS